MLKAPRGSVDRIGEGGGDFVFPEGNYRAILEEVRTRGIPTSSDGDPFAGYVTDDGVVLGLQFGSIEPLDVEVEVGNRKFFVDVPLRDGEIGLEEVDIDADNVPHWQLQRAARRVFTFFDALGMLSENGDGTVAVPNEALAELEAGKLNGAEIGLSIYNSKEKVARWHRRKEEDPNAERQVYDELRKFFAIS